LIGRANPKSCRLRVNTVANALRRYGVPRRIRVAVQAVAAEAPMGGKRNGQIDNRDVWIGSHRRALASRFPRIDLPSPIARTSQSWRAWR
jgi:hypothetical protein